MSRRLGYSGGLKELERSLGIGRKSEVAEIDGFEATVLWAKYLRGDNAALENLIDYNTEDVVHLKAIMEICYDKMSERTAEYLPQSMPSLFAGVSEVPKSRERRFHLIGGPYQSDWNIRRNGMSLPKSIGMKRLCFAR